MVLLIHFTLLAQILISLPPYGFLSHHKEHRKRNKTATGAKSLHIMLNIQATMAFIFLLPYTFRKVE